MAAPDREPITVTADGIVVRKTLNHEDFDTMAIVYEATSDRDHDTRFHIEDEVPAGISTEDIKFHPEHAPAESSISAESVTIEVQLASGEDSRIVLGIMNDSEDEPEVFTAEPTIELLETEARASGSDSIGETSDMERTGERLATGGVVRVLANELRRDELDEQARRLLRDELLDPESALENQLSELEDRIDEFAVYEQPMEDFLSEHGPAERIRSAFRDELREIEEAVRPVQDRTDQVLNGVENVQDRIESAGDDLESVGARMGTLEERLQRIQDEIGGFEERMEDNQGETEQVQSGVRALEQRAGNLEGNVADFKEDLESMRESILGDIRGIEADLEEFESFRDRFSAALGGEEGPLDVEPDDG